MLLRLSATLDGWRTWEHLRCGATHDRGTVGRSKGTLALRA